MNESQERVLDKFNRILKSKDRAVFTRLDGVEVDQDVEDTKTKVKFYTVALDGNLMPTVKELAEFIVSNALNYCIPAKDIADAKEQDKRHGNDRRVSALVKQAHTLFTNLKKTGEPGELLLYIIVRDVLHFPLLMCKMSLKTNTEVHYHGVDGVHAKVEKDGEGKRTLGIYWGESKVYAKLGSAISECIKSLQSYVLVNAKGGAKMIRDKELISSNINIVDDDMREALLLYFDKDNPESNQVNYRGVALIGFDEKSYPTQQNTKSKEALHKEVKEKIAGWTQKIKDAIAQYDDLETVELHFFLVPLPSVDEFRSEFRKALQFS